MMDDENDDFNEEDMDEGWNELTAKIEGLARGLERKYNEWEMWVMLREIMFYNDVDLDVEDLEEMLMFFESIEEYEHCKTIKIELDAMNVKKDI